MPRLATALLVALTLSACDSTTPAVPMAGRYVLDSVSGAALPVDADFTDTFGVTNERLLVSAALTVGPDGTWAEARTYSNPHGRWIVHSEGVWSGDRMETRAGPVAMIRTVDGLECEHADGVYRYRLR